MQLNFEQILAEEPELPSEGTKIGEYEVLSPIGEGSYSVVFLSHHERLDREVALKIMRPSAVRRSPGLPQRFLREIDMVSHLEHPNIVRLYDFGESEDGLLWMATEVIRGRMLSTILQGEGALPFERARRVALQTLSGLVQAHESGIVHCDLKPDNVMLTRKGAEPDWVQLLDFGIAQIVTAEGEWASEEKGAVQGTPRYMAPEQFKHEGIGPHTDVYALGLVLYEMLVGRPAIEGETLTEVLRQIMQVPLVFPEGLEGTEIAEIIRCATSRRWQERYASAMAMYRALEACRDPNAAIEPPSIVLELESDAIPLLVAEPDDGASRADSEAVDMPAPRRSGGGVVIAGAVLVVLLALLGIGFIWFGPATGETEPRKATVVTALTGKADAVSLEDSSSEAIPPRLGEGGGHVAPAEPALSADVSWTLSSQPEGASVYRGEDRLCEATPCKVEFKRSDEALELTFELTGHVREVASFIPEQGGQLVVPLRRRVVSNAGGGGNQPTRKKGGGTDLFNVPHH